MTSQETQIATFNQICTLARAGLLKDAESVLRDAMSRGEDTSMFSATYANLLISNFDWDAIHRLIPRGINSLFMSGWLKSIKFVLPINMQDEPIPWINYAAIDFLDSISKKDWRVFEFGCGASTLWWSKRVTEVAAVEDSEEWFREITRLAPSNARIALSKDKDSYVGSIGAQTDRKFDAVIVDGSHRLECAVAAVGRVSESGIIVFDNSDEESANEALLHIQSNGFNRIDFWGLIPAYVYKNCTSVFFRDPSSTRATRLPSEHVSTVGCSCAQAGKIARDITSKKQ